MMVWPVSRVHLPAHIEEGVFGMGNMLLLLLNTSKFSRLDTLSPDGLLPLWLAYRWYHSYLLGRGLSAQKR